jgi:hypothetical protein
VTPPFVRRARLVRLVTGAFVLGVLAAAPSAALGHSLSVTYQSRLPLAVYLIGAGMAVALSFVFVLVSDVRANPPERTGAGRIPPAWLRFGLRLVGLVGWIWIVAQGIAGGTSAGDVSTLFLWVYGWVLTAALSAIVGPVWHWLDPFATLFDIGARALRAVGVGGWEPAEYPARLGRWPAVAGLLFIVWLELVGQAGPSTLFIVLLGYTAFTLAMMAQFGKEAWRRDGETFSVWFGLLNRLAPFALVDGGDRVRRRPFFSGLLEPGWTIADVVIIGIGTGSILFDGLSQTTAWFDVFGAPGVAVKTLQLLGFLGLITAAAVSVTRFVGTPATGAGLLPIAVGYLVAHYFTYVLIDGQRLVIAIADPLQQGWDLGGFGWAFHEPNASFLPPGLVWTVQIAAVVGGHMLGAWGGHVVAASEADRRGVGSTAVRRRQVPLAVVMVALTTLTLWSLGQSLLVEAPPDGTPAAAIARAADGGLALAPPARGSS